MKKISVFALIAAVLFLFLSLMPLGGEMEIYDKVIRLHILANSNSECDQAQKLLVRDAVLEKIGSYGEMDNIEGAAEYIGSKTEDIKETALETLENCGFNGDVIVTLTKEYYETRSYDGFSLPSGEYLSLRVMIGKAEGKNWWCVLYPPLCLSSARKSDTLVQAGFTPGQVKVITESESPRYRIKFRIVEIFEELKRSIFG